MATTEITHEELEKLLRSIYTDTSKIYNQIIRFEGTDENRKKNLYEKAEEVVTYCETMYEKYIDNANVLKTLEIATRLLRKVPKCKETRKKICDRLDFLIKEYDKNKKSNES